MNYIYSFLSEGMDQRPAYGFSHRLRASVEKDQITPSPLDYHAEKVFLGTSSKAFSFGHRPRTNYVNDTPGPGEYFISEEAPKRRKSGYSFGSKSSSKRLRSTTPGPKYMPESREIFQHQKGFSFGHRPKFGRKVSDTPGPGKSKRRLYTQNNFTFQQANTTHKSFCSKKVQLSRLELRTACEAKATFFEILHHRLLLIDRKRQKLKIHPLIPSGQNPVERFFPQSSLILLGLENTKQQFLCSKVNETDFHSA
jgi:hypothetical protein